MLIDIEGVIPCIDDTKEHFITLWRLTLVMWLEADRRPTGVVRVCTPAQTV